MASSEHPSPHQQPNYAAQDSDEPISERRTLRDYIIILRERFWIALPLALLISIGTGYYKSSQTPLYAANATLRFEKPQISATGTSTVMDLSARGAVDINTYLQEFVSAEIRGRVVRSLTPDEIRILQRPYMDQLEPGQDPPSAGSALGSLSVNDIRDSYIIRVGVTHPDGEAAALVANRYVDEFMNYILDQRFRGTTEAADFLQERADKLRMEAEDADRALQAYQRRHNLVSLDSTTNLIRGRLLAADQALTAARLERIRVAELFNQVESYQNQGRNLLELSFISSHGTVTDISVRLSELRKNQSILAERYLERHPRKMLAANEIAITEQQLEKAIQDGIADLRSTFEKAQSAEAAMRSEYEIAEADQRRLNDLSSEYNSLLNQAEIARNNFKQITERLATVNVEVNLENVPVRPLDRATRPGTPFTPHIPGILRSSIMIFFVVFIGVAVGLSFIDDRIKSAWDVENFIGVNLLGIIPDLSALKDEEKYSLVLENRQTPGTESFLSVYSAAKIHSKLDFPNRYWSQARFPAKVKPSSLVIFPVVSPDTDERPC
ncbi:MAG: GumC family protein [Opitutaceae bacterium]|nr:GumC family protein [Opitutaceae bacterium]